MSHPGAQEWPKNSWNGCPTLSQTHYVWEISTDWWVLLKCVNLRDPLFSFAKLIFSLVSKSCATPIGRIPPTVLQWTKKQTYFGSLVAQIVLLLRYACAVNGYGRTENWLLVFSWVDHSRSAKIGTHSDFSNDPKGPWSCNTANMDLLVKHVTTHLTKCCQESFNYLNSGTLNCCGWRANTSTVLRWVFRILWKISLWFGILPQADRSQHGSTELTIYWDTKRDSKIPSDMIRPQGTFEPNSDWLPKNLAAVITQLFAWSGI